MTWKVEIVPQLDGICIEWLAPERVLFSRRNEIYEANEPLGKRRLVGVVNTSKSKQLISKFRLGQRLLRFMIYNALPLADDSIFLTFGKQIGVLKNGKYQELGGVARPFRVLRGACAMSADGAIYFGEYFDNPTRGEMHVYRYRTGADSIEIAFTFPPQTIRHIHGVYRDSFSDDLYCLAGDSESESRIVKTADNFETVEIIGTGDETWRTVSVQFTADALFYATDAEFRQNYIYRFDRRTGERKILAEIDGPVYYSQKIGDDIFFVVTAELAPVQTKPQASIWHVNADGAAREIYSVRKQIPNKKAAALFMPGTLHFPYLQNGARETFLHAVSLQGVDNRSLRLYQSDEGQI